MFKQICAAVALFVFALAAAAQSPAQNWGEVKAPAIGTSVRISVGSRTVKGLVQGIADDSLAVDSGKGQEAFMRDAVLRVSVKKESHRGQNTLIGLGAGAAIGATVAAASTAGEMNCLGICAFAPSRVRGAEIGAIGFGIIGTVIGALIPTGGWREVYNQ